MATNQKPIRLDEPIDDSAPPTIYASKLTPELSNAALNLTIDFQRQKQSAANQHVLKHPITIAIAVGATALFAYVQVGAAVKQGGLVAIKYHTDKIFQILVFLAMITSIVFTIATRPTDIIKDNADALAEDASSVFGFDLKDFIKINPQTKDKASKALLAKGENSNIVIYRDTPIAILTLDQSTHEQNTFVTKITGVGIRKVYYKSGIIDDLFDFAIKRSGELNNALKNPKAKVLILIQVLSTDKQLKKTLTQRDFQYIEKKPINDSKILKFYGINHEIWGIGLNVQKLSDIKSKAGSTGFKAN